MSFRKGDIILRDDLAYPEGALVVDGFDANQNLLAHPMGGGLQMAIPSAELPRFQITEAFERTSIFRRAPFSIEGVEGIFSGWTDGRVWNGWAMPWFEFEEAKRLVGAVCPSSNRFDANSDSFATTVEKEEEELWKAEIVDLPDGGTIKLYPVGASSWIWKEESP